MIHGLYSLEKSPLPPIEKRKGGRKEDKKKEQGKLYIKRLKVIFTFFLKANLYLYREKFHKKIYRQKNGVLAFKCNFMLVYSPQILFSLLL